MISQLLEYKVGSAWRYHADIRRVLSRELDLIYNPKKPLQQAKKLTELIENIEDEDSAIALARNIGSLIKFDYTHLDLSTLILEERQTKRLELKGRTLKKILEYALKPEEEKTKKERKEESQAVKELMRKIKNDNTQGLVASYYELGNLYRNYADQMLIRRERSLKRIIAAYEKSIFYFYLSKSFKHKGKKSRIEREDLLERHNLLTRLEKSRKIKDRFDRYDFINDMMRESAGLSGAIFVYCISMLKRCLANIMNSNDAKKHRKLTSGYKRNFKAVEEAKEEMDKLIGPDGHYSEEEWDRIIRRSALRYMETVFLIGTDKKRIREIHSFYERVSSLKIDRPKILGSPPHEEVKKIAEKILFKVYEQFLPESIKRRKKTKEAIEIIQDLLTEPVIYDARIEVEEEIAPYISLIGEWRNILESKLEPYKIVVPIFSEDRGNNFKQEIEKAEKRYERNNRTNHLLFHKMFKDNNWLKRQAKKRARQARYEIFDILRTATEFKLKRKKKEYKNEMNKLREYASYSAYIPIYVAIKTGRIDIGSIYTAAQLKWEARKKFDILKRAGLY